MAIADRESEVDRESHRDTGLCCASDTNKCPVGLPIEEI